MAHSVSGGNSFQETASISSGEIPQVSKTSTYPKITAALTVIYLLSTIVSAGGGHYFHLPVHGDLGTCIYVQTAALVALGFKRINFDSEKKKQDKEKQCLKQYFQDDFEKIMRGESPLPTEEFLQCLEAHAPMGDEEFVKEHGDRRRTLDSPVDFPGKTDFEKDTNRSSLSDLGFKEPDKGRIGFINGMLHDYGWTVHRGLYISHLAGGYNVHMVNNATHGACKDLQECAMGLRQSVATDPVWHLHAMWDEFFDQAGEDETFLQICHSQGCIHTRNALESYDPQRRQRIRVLAVAPGGYMHNTDDKQYHSVRHLKTKSDIVPKLDREGKGEAEGVEVLDCEGMQHSFDCPVYQEPLRQALQDYLDDPLVK